jgi:hypothetical protein
MDRTFRRPRSAAAPGRRIRGGWAWLLAVALAGIAGAVGSPGGRADAAQTPVDRTTAFDPVDTSQRRS